MAIGIGGAGGKLASLMSPNSVAVNVSETELQKTNASQKVMAFAHSEKGQLKGSKKDPAIGKSAFNSIRAQILELIQGNMVISSSGGGTGNGITAAATAPVCLACWVSLLGPAFFSRGAPCCARWLDMLKKHCDEL